MRIDVPILQCIAVDGNELSLYYPNEKKGVVIESRVAPETPVLSPVLFWMRVDSVLSSGRFRRVPDSAVERWRAKDESAKATPEITISRDETGRPTAIRAWGGDSMPTQEMSYGEFSKISDSSHVPTHIKVVRSGGNGAAETEEIKIQRVEVGVPRPEPFAACEPSPGAKFTRRKW